MAIPASSSPRPTRAGPAEADWTEARPGLGWSALGTEEKHERILCAAGRVFARHGLDAPMPAVAAEAGAGVASLYRQFPSKRDLLAALVIRRLRQTCDAAGAAAAGPGNHWQGLREMLLFTLERHTGDDFLGDAWSLVEDHEEVRIAAAATQEAFTRLIDLGRAEGAIRSDATALDVRLLFVATRASRQVHDGAWRRALELMLDGLAAR